jgi:polysaccharide transporter, PST family
MRRLLKVAAANSIVTLVRLVVGLLTNKLYAVMLGPAGYTALANISNVFNLVHAASQAGMSNGVAVHVAQNVDSTQQRNFVHTGIMLSLWAAGGLAVILLGVQLSGILPQMSLTLFAALVGTLILASPLGTLTGYFNGNEDNLPIYWAQSVGAVLLLLVVWVCYVLGRADLMFASVGAAVLGAALTLLFFGFKRGLFSAVKEFRFIEIYARPLFGYLLIGAVSGIVAQLMQIAVRMLMAHKFGDDVAGYWQASWRLSEAYLAVLAQTIAMVLLPRYSRATTQQQLKKSVAEGVVLFAGGALLLCSFVFYFADSLVLLLFSEKFVDAVEFIKVQVIGDFLKIISWVLAYVMLAKGSVKMFMLTEVIAGTVFVAFTALAINFAPNVLNANYAYIATYVIYTLMVLAVAIHIIKTMPVIEPIEGQNINA